MTRVTLSEFKGAARNRTLRRSAVLAGNRPPVTPMPQAQSAIRRFHHHGPTQATTVLRQTFARSAYWGPGGHASARGWAASIESCFATYVRLAGSDGRPVLPTPIRRDVVVGAHAIGVAPDVILLDPAGYVARLVLWDIPVPDQSEAELLAAPVVVALEEELGAGRTVGVEIWHLRTGQQFFVTAHLALSRMAEVRTVLLDYLE